jgi:ATP-dependent Clp protease adaptor protein ClpS
VIIHPTIRCSNEEDSSEQTGTITVVRTELTPPKKYQVLMHNDDYTTMEFVILVLKKFFNKADKEAHGIMMKIHTDGLAICGIYTCEVAESKTQKVNKYSKDSGHPLTCTFEPCQ